MTINKNKMKNISKKNKVNADDLLKMNSINNRINEEISYEVIEQISDNEMLNDYKKCESVINKINILTNILNKHNIVSDVKESILDDYLLELIPNAQNV